METEKYYFRVGLFFIVAAVAFVFYLIAFAKGVEDMSTRRYAIYFDHSVAGLSKAAPVKLNGIDVGMVSEIRFVSRDSDRVLVVADISENAPVRSDTVASVTFQGITGATYLSLENMNVAQNVPPLKVEKGEEYPVIQARQSDLQSLLSDAPELMGKVSVTVSQAQKLLSDKNVAAAQGLLPEAHDALTEAAGAFREIKMLARTLREDPSIILHGTKYNGYQVPQR